MEWTRDGLEASLRAARVPEHLHDGLVEHVLTARPVGSFLTAVLNNDLLGAVSRMGSDLAGDDLRATAKWLYNDAPSQCWGTPAKVKAWQGLE